MSARALVVTLGVLAVIGLLAFGLVSKGQARLAVGDSVPTASLPQLGSEQTGSLADYRGRWVLLNVWASWCAPCRDEAPALQRFYREHRSDRFEVLGIDTKGDATEEGLDFVRRYGLTYPQLHDGSGDYADELRTTGVPESFLVDPSGELAAYIPGAITDTWLRDEVEPLIEGG